MCKRDAEIENDLVLNQIVVIHDIRFKGKRAIEWNDVKAFLGALVGSEYVVAQTKDIVHIAKDFPDEYTGSKYTYSLKGALAKAKANAAQAIPELIQSATGKRFQNNRDSRHRRNAKYGWYHYDIRFALPVYDSHEQLERFNVFTGELLIRHANDGKLYLYDILKIKKETSNSFGHEALLEKNPFLNN